MRKLIISVFIILTLSLSGFSYENYNSFVKSIKALKKIDSKNVNIKIYGKSTEGKKLYVVEVGKSNKPGVFIGGNITGYKVDSSYEVLEIAKYIIKNYKLKFKDFNFIIIPVLNPDVYEYYFSKRNRYFRKYNKTPYNDDRDSLIDEDGFEDLNKDGKITMMRKKSIEGTYIIDKKYPDLMRRANKYKGEKGIYKIYTEGIDNDNDGRFNEDEIGGVELNKNFPHRFKSFKKGSGLYPVSEKESIALLNYLFSKKNIFFAFIIDEENNMMKLPVESGKSKLSAEKYKIPKRFGKWLGIDTSKEYTIKEIREFIKPFTRGMKVSDAMIASFFGFGPRLNYNESDLKYMEEFAKHYKKLLKELKISKDRKYKGNGFGSLSYWLYFQYGIPVISLDSFTIPVEKDKNKKQDKNKLTAEKLGKMSTEEFLKLDKKVIEKFLKENNAPPQFSADRLIMMVKSGKITPKMMAKFMNKMPKKDDKDNSKPENLNLYKWLKKNKLEKKFIKWKKFNHPQLGLVEIGGFAPYCGIVPPINMTKEFIKINTKMIEWILTKKPELLIKEIKLKRKAGNIFELKFYLVNNGYLPLNFTQGVTNGKQFPVLVRLKAKGLKILSGDKLYKVNNISGMGGWKKFEVLFSTNSNNLVIQVESRKYGKFQKLINLK